MKRLVCVLVAVLSVSVSVNAQLKFSNNKLTYGPVSSTFANSGYDVTMKGNQFYWANPGEGAWLRIVFDSNNRVAIGGSSQIIRFHGPSSLSGNNIGNTSYNDVYAGNVYCYSDARAKTNVMNLSNSTSKIMKMRPVSYEFKNKSANAGRSTNRDMGFLAQELQEIIPEAVTMSEDGEMLVNYITVIPLLTNAIQELNIRIEELEAELESVKK